MRGGAGLGKSTLAHKIVDSLQADGRLATFAFLLRDSSSDAATVIQQMARELGALHPRAIPGVAVAARTCKASHQPLHEYMESYIIKPIHSLSYPYPLVIVIDGLDEWDHHEVFLEELEHISPMSPIKILLISRPNHSIERSLLKVSVQKYNLPPVSQAITEAYFSHFFEKIDWKMRKPSSFTISNLARLADGLLIWAAMVCSFLSYKMRPDSPHELLEQIIASGKQIALESQLSNLYHDALKQLFQNNKEQQLFQRVFGAMTVLREPLPLRDFARLLGMYVTVDQIMEVQSRLTALQTRGTFDKDIVPPASQCFHSSFLEFTMDREIDASNPLIPYLINPQKAHQSLAEGCLRSLSHFFSLFRGSKRIHPDLRGLELYAVEFWPLHVANSNDRFTPLTPKLENVLLEFAESHLRQWASLFLAISLPTASSQNWDEVVDRIDKDGFYCSLAGFLKDQMNPALASRITLCLEVAVRLQPKYEKAWGDLGTSYQKQFNSIGTLDLINNSITVYRHALKLCSKDGNRGTSMSNLGVAVWQRFSRAGSVTDLEESISLLRESLSLLCSPHPDRHTSLISFSNALRSRFQVVGSMADLEEAILVLHESVSLQPDNSTSIGYLASALLSRFRETKSDIDLEQGISMLHELLLLINTPAERSWILGHLGNALRDRFGTTGSIADLEEAISVLRESLSLDPVPRDHYSSQSLEKLAYALRNRFKITRSMIDLEEAILMYRESLSLRPKPHPDRPRSLNYLSDTLCDRFEETGSITDIHEAISLRRESLSLLPAPHPDRPQSLEQLAYTLRSCFKTTHSMLDLEEAILLYRESLCLCPASPYSWVMEGLASALETRFNVNGVQIDLSEATSLRQQALALSQ
jgi:tetratricopeptide (TPR) repeat protein